MAGSARKIRRIMVAADGSEHSERALDFGIYLAKSLSAELDIVHAVNWEDISREVRASNLTDAEKQSEQLAAENRRKAAAWLDKFGDRAKAAGVANVSARVVIEPGKSHVKAVVDNADATLADLIIVGTRGHGRLKKLLVGSFANGVIGEASKPVLVIK